MAAARVDKCKKGHRLTERNTIYRSNGRRRCRVCHNEAQKKSRAKKQDAPPVAAGPLEAAEGPGPNAQALERAIKQLTEKGVLDESIDAPRIESARSMARVLDDRPFNSQFWKVYIELVDALTSTGRTNDDDDLAEIINKVRAEVRDPQTT